MPREKNAFINVDELLPQVSLEQAAAFYGVALPELKRIGAETRTRCFLNCGRTEETGDRALAIQTDHPARQWKCHAYSCGKGGNLVSLCDLLKPGDSAGGRPRGDRFKAIAADLQAMARGIAPAEPPSPRPATVTAPIPKPKLNVPLAQSNNERARALTDLDRKLMVDLAEMSPKAAQYFRRRPFLSSEVCRKWRVGYLPHDVGGEDKAGGTMRGKIVFALLSEKGEVLTWFGRDPEFEEKHQLWITGGRVDREPEKYHFVKGFHRGLELYGQHGAVRLKEPGVRERLRELGLVVVEGATDVIALSELGVPAVGLCSNHVSVDQAKKLARWAKELAGGVVTLMLDCDVEGENGARQTIWTLAQQCRVRLAWSLDMHGGRFKGRQPESLSAEEWATLAAPLVG